MIARKQGYRAERTKLRSQMKDKNFTDKLILAKKIFGEYVKGWKDDWNSFTFRLQQNLMRSLSMTSALTVGAATSNVILNR